MYIINILFLFFCAVVFLVLILNYYSINILTWVHYIRILLYDIGYLVPKNTVFIIKKNEVGRLTCFCFAAN
jgi:hypothetical protein